MTTLRLSRRRALQLAGAAAVPCVVLDGLLTRVSGQGESASKATRQEPTKSVDDQQPRSEQSQEKGMDIGAFSVSLAVKDLEASRTFYEKFGFRPFAGAPKQHWQILKNGDHVIGLFQGLFEKNILTFNPGWDQNAKKLDSFTDIREIQRRLKAQGVELTLEVDEKQTKGPASLMAVDPDGNQILLDQHV